MQTEGIMDIIESNRENKKNLAVGKESCINHSVLNGGGLSTSCNKSFQVFVKVLSQQSHSIPLNLQGSESEPDLRKKVRVFAGLPQNQEKMIRLSSRGQELKSAS